MARNIQAGQAAEREARAFLEAHGLSYLASNFRCRYGEIDLVMQEDAALIIVEVRYRRRDSFMDPSESITRAKQQRIARTAAFFLQKNRRRGEPPIRFDVVSLTGPLGDLRIRWLRGAFDAEGMTLR